MKCPNCGCVAHKHGKTDKGKQRYKCSNWQCDKKTFTEDGNKKVFIIQCPNCKKETEGEKFGRVYYYTKCKEETEGFRFGRVSYDAKGIRKHRYKCSECGVVTVKLVREEERRKTE